MNVLPALLGAVTGLGLLAAVAGLRGRAPRPARARRPGSGRRLLAMFVVAAGVLAWTRWPMGALLAAAAAWWLPALLGPDRDHAAALARIEAIASWTESLRDTLAASAGLEQTLIATADMPPAPIAAEVRELAAALRAGERLPAALRRHAGALADPTADLVLAALLLAAEQQARDLGPLLGRLAAAAREQAGMRMRVAAGRARIRASVRIIVTATAVFVAALLVGSRGYLRPYDSPLGQLVLLAAGGCFAAAFVWLGRISRVDRPQRLLTRLTPEERS